MPVSKKSGYPRTEVEVDGRKYGFLLDTGASFTMVSEVLLKSWGKEHQDWRRQSGAVGEAATLGGQTLETMFLPGGKWGTQVLPEERLGRCVRCISSSDDLPAYRYRIQ